MRALPPAVAALAVLSFVAIPFVAAGAQPDSGSAVAVTRAASPGLAAGTRVRVELASPLDHPTIGFRSMTGSLVRVDADSVVVDGEYGRVSMPRAHVRTVSVRDTSATRGGAVAEGAVSGLLVGALVGGIFGGALNDGECDIMSCASRSETAMQGALVVGALGMFIGAASGATSDAERWRPVALSASSRVGVTATARGVALAVRF